MAKKFLLLGSINAMLAIILGAFGAHALRYRLSPRMLNVYHIANQYHFYHALGLLAVGVIALHKPKSTLISWSGWLMFAGLVLFSGSLYLLSITGTFLLGFLTPVGGTALIVSWALLFVGIWKEF